MTVTGTMKGYGSSARHKAEAVSHRMKDKALEKRLERATGETDRLRLENEVLRDEVEEARSEHRRILDMLEERLPENGEGKSHKGRWMLFLLALGGGAYMLIRRMREQEDWETQSSEAGGGIRGGSPGL